jgi:hypothetical protein
VNDFDDFYPVDSDEIAKHPDHVRELEKAVEKVVAAVLYFFALNYRR